MRTPTTVNLYLQNPLPVLFPTPKLVSSNSKPNFLNFISKNGNRGFSGQFTAKLAGIRPRPMSDDSSSSNESLAASNGDRGRPVLERQLHFAKFETQKINDCIDFIQSKQLRLTGSEQHGASGSTKSVIKAIGGGAFKYADLFKEKLGISLERQMKWTVLWPEQIFCLSSVVVIILGYLLALLLIQLEPL